MPYLILRIIIFTSTGLLFLGACSNSNPTITTNNNPATSSPNSTSTAAKTNKTHGATKGGQVVETGDYHLEFVPKKEANQTHIDLYLQTGDSHATVADAKVTAQVQLPDGTQKTIPFTYDAKDKHYTGILKENQAGQYQVKISADIQDKKVDGRFNFNR